MEAFEALRQGYYYLLSTSVIVVGCIVVLQSQGVRR